MPARHGPRPLRPKHRVALPSGFGRGLGSRGGTEDFVRLSDNLRGALAMTVAMAAFTVNDA